jgi:hypothetical protein
MAEVGEALRLRWRPVQRGQVALRDEAGLLHHLPVLMTYSEGGAPAVELFQRRPGTPFDSPWESAFHHVGYWVDDIPGEVERLEDMGWTCFATILSESGSPSRFCMHRSGSGIGLEAVDVTVLRPWLADLYPRTSPFYSATPAPPP